MDQDGIPPQPSDQPSGLPQGQHGQPSQPPQVPQPPPGYVYSPAPVQYPEESQAVLSLVLSIIGLVACSGLLCPFGWHFANKDLEGIAAGRRDPTKKDLATAGKIIGIIGTVLIGLFVVGMIGFILIAVASAAAGA